MRKLSTTLFGTSGRSTLVIGTVVSASAYAANPPTITFTPGIFTSPSWTTESGFENFQGDTIGSAPKVTPVGAYQADSFGTGTVQQGASALNPDVSNKYDLLNAHVAGGVYNQVDVEGKSFQLVSFSVSFSSDTADKLGVIRPVNALNANSLI